MKKPMLVGIWIFAWSPQGKFTKWGRDGDDNHPFYAHESFESEKAVRHLMDQNRHKDDNGRIKEWQIARN